MSGTLLAGAAVLVELSLDAFTRMLVQRFESGIAAELDNANAALGPDAAIHLGLDLEGGRPVVTATSALLTRERDDPSSPQARHIVVTLHLPHVETRRGRGPLTAWSDVRLVLELLPYVSREAPSRDLPGVIPYLRLGARDIRALDAAGNPVAAAPDAYTAVALVKAMLGQLRLAAPDASAVGVVTARAAIVLGDDDDPTRASLAIIYTGPGGEVDDNALRTQIRRGPTGLEDYAITVANDTLLAAVADRVLSSRKIQGLEAYHLERPCRLRTPVWVRLGSGGSSVTGELTRLEGTVEDEALRVRVSLRARRIYAAPTVTRTIAHDLSDAGVFEQMIDVGVHLELRIVPTLGPGGTALTTTVTTDLRLELQYTPLFWIWLALSIVVLAPLSGVALAVAASITALVMATVVPLLLGVFSAARTFDGLLAGQVNLSDLAALDDIDLRALARAIAPNRLERLTLDDLTLASDRVELPRPRVLRVGLDRPLRPGQGLDLDLGDIVADPPRLHGPATIAARDDGLWQVSPERRLSAPEILHAARDELGFLTGSFRGAVRTAGGRLAILSAARRPGDAGYIISYRTLEQRADDVGLMISAEPLYPPRPDVGPALDTTPIGVRYTIRAGVRAGIDEELARASYTWSVAGRGLSGLGGELLGDDGVRVAWSAQGPTLRIDAPRGWTGGEITVELLLPGGLRFALRDVLVVAAPPRPYVDPPIDVAVIPAIRLPPISEARSAPGGAAGLVHEATPATIAGNSTYLDHPWLDGQPDAVVLVTPHRSADPGHLGVWYDGRRWAVFRQDRRTMAPLRLTIAIAPGHVHTATAANTTHNYSHIEHPLADGRPDARVFVTQRWNPAGANGGYNDHAVGVFYDASAARWAIYNEDRTPLGPGLQFNFWVDLSASTGASPLADTGPDDLVLATHNWNPEGRAGAYFDAAWALELDPTRTRWHVVDAAGAPPPPDIAFNVLRLRG
jgi:hypothetical protein